MFDQDIIFRRHAEEKLDPKDQPTSVETKNQDHPGFIHHPSGLVIKKKHPGQSNYYKIRWWYHVIEQLFQMVTFISPPLMNDSRVFHSKFCNSVQIIIDGKTVSIQIGR